VLNTLMASTNILAQAGGKGGAIIIFLMLVIGFIALVLLITLASRYKKCPSNRILVVYGKTGKGAARCVHGGAAFVWPLIQAYDFLDLEPFVVPIDLNNALSSENIRVTVPTTVTAAISNQPGIMQNAAIRLLGQSQKQIQDQAQDIILGQMRAVIATMKIEDINRDRQAFMAAVNEAVSGELEKIGLAVINVNIRDIDDESGYIKAIGRKAAAVAINQANIDVTEQEKLGKTGVAERERDTRKAVAAANANAEIGEALANRDKRMQVADLDAEAVHRETDANAKKAGYQATQRVAEESARNMSESAAREADGAIRVAQENAQKKAEDARATREEARLNAEIVVPAEAKKKQVVIAADARKEQAIRIAEGEAAAVLARMTAQGQGTQAVLEGKANGYERLVAACNGDKGAAALLLIEKLIKVAGVQAQAIKDLPIEKVIVWDGGGDGKGLSGLGGRLISALPPMHELAKNVGLDLPEYLGKLAGEAADEKQSPQPKREPPAPTAGT